MQAIFLCHDLVSFSPPFFFSNRIGNYSDNVNMMMESSSVSPVPPTSGINVNNEGAGGGGDGGSALEVTTTPSEDQSPARGLSGLAGTYDLYCSFHLSSLTY